MHFRRHLPAEGSLLAIVTTTVRRRVPRFRSRGGRDFFRNFLLFEDLAIRSWRPLAGRLRRVTSEAKWASRVAPRNFAGGSGCGSAPTPFVGSVRQQAAFDSRQPASPLIGGASLQSAAVEHHDRRSPRRFLVSSLELGLAKLLDYGASLRRPFLANSLREPLQAG
jgi:hypothetical protein